MWSRSCPPFGSVPEPPVLPPLLFRLWRNLPRTNPMLSSILASVSSAISYRPFVLARDEKSLDHVSDNSDSRLFLHPYPRYAYYIHFFYSHSILSHNTWHSFYSLTIHRPYSDLLFTTLLPPLTSFSRATTPTATHSIRILLSFHSGHHFSRANSLLVAHTPSSSSHTPVTRTFFLYTHHLLPLTASTLFTSAFHRICFLKIYSRHLFFPHALLYLFSHFSN